MWGALAKLATPVLKWLAQFLLLPLIRELIESLLASRKETRDRAERHKEVDEDVKKVEDAVTPEEQENALEELAKRARARRRK